MIFWARLVIIIAVTAFLAAGGAFCFVFTTEGSAWLIKRELMRATGASGITFGSSSGNLLRGTFTRDIKVDGLPVDGVNARVTIDQATIKLVWKSVVPGFEIAAKGLKLEPNQLMEGLSAVSLSFEDGSLSLEGLAIVNLSKLPMENQIRIDRIFIKSPADDGGVFRASQISVEFQDANLSAESVLGTPKNLVVEDVRMSSRSLLKNPVSAQIQRLEIAHPFAPQDITSVHNGRIFMAGSDPVLAYGTLQSGQLDFHVFSKNIVLNDLLLALKVPGVSMAVNDMEISITGTLSRMKIAGRFEADASYRRFFLKEVSVPSFDLSLDMTTKDRELSGVLDIRSGNIIHHNTKLHFRPGKIFFKGDPETPFFDLNAGAVIEDTDIHAQLRGTPHKPELHLSSDPSYPEEKILVMLGTGKEWSGSEKAISEGRLSLDALNEFIDYFVLGGNGEKFAKRFGIKELSVRADEYTKRVELKKRITKKVDVGYGVEKGGLESEKSAVAQKLGVDYKASANTMISVEGKVSSKTEASDKLDDQDLPADRSLTMKVKKSF